MAYKVPQGYQAPNCGSFLDSLITINDIISSMNSALSSLFIEVSSRKTLLANPGLSQPEKDILNAELDALAAAIDDILDQKLVETENQITETENWRVCQGMPFRLAGPSNQAPSTAYVGYMYYDTSYSMPTWFDGYQYLTADGTFPGTDITSPYNPITYLNGMRNGIVAIAAFESGGGLLPTTIYELGQDSTFNARFNLLTKSGPDRTILYQQYPIINQGVVGRYIQVYPTDSEPTFYPEDDVATTIANA